MKNQINWQHKGTKKTLAALVILALGITSFTDSRIPAEAYTAPSSTSQSEPSEEKPDYMKTTSEKIEDTQQTISELEQEKDEIDQQASEINERKNSLLIYMDELNANLQELSTQMEDTQQKLEQKKAEVDETTEKLKKAKKKEKKQYDQMKSRISYIYQNGSSSYLEAIVDADSFREMLNRVDYVQELTSYDQSRMSNYQEAANAVKKTKKALDKQEKELQDLREEQQNNKQKITATIENTQRVVELKNKELAQAQENSNALAQKISEQKAYEQQLEAKRAMENTARLSNIYGMEQALAESKLGQIENGGVIGPGYSEMDFALMAAIIDCEAEGETYEGKLAVGSVVMNRVLSPQFPNTIAGVIYSPGQFAPVTSGRFAAMLASNGATQECRNAAYEVLNGHITNDFLFFRTIIPGFPATIIDHQMFY